jgi:pimeloyl-ACP methyl ester carboxylesterase
MKKIKNIQITREHQKPIVTDLFYIKNNQPKPIVIFCHGYKGFKDWGAWNLMAEQFAENDFFFVKFNFSHNGGTIENPIDFPDLEAFGNNNYTIELDDLESVIDWVLNENSIEKEIDKTKLFLIGHSRAGGIVTIKASENMCVTKVISWAGVSNFANRFPKGEALKKWKDEGVFYVINGRTKQQMPHYYQYYENFFSNENRLTIQRAVKSLTVPYLIIHGTKDEAVSVKEAEQLHQWSTKSELKIIENATHTFGINHPHQSSDLSKEMQNVVSETIFFLRK